MPPPPPRVRLFLCRFLSGSRFSSGAQSDASLGPSHRLFSLPPTPHKSTSSLARAPKLRSVSVCSYPSLWFVGRRGICSGTPAEDYSKEVDEINLKFAEAREEIDAAMESKDTVYFDEEAECAREAVKEALNMFEGLLRRLPEKERAALQRSMGLKMEQLKAEVQQLDE